MLKIHAILNALLIYLKAATISKLDIFSIKVTRSWTLGSFAKVLLVEYTCQYEVSISYGSKVMAKIKVFLILARQSQSQRQTGQKLEWGCPNGTKYPPRQPIQTIQVMHQIGEAVMRQKPFSVILAL